MLIQGDIKMTKPNLFYSRHSIGLDKIINRVIEVSEHQNSVTYPPFNTIQLPNNFYEIQVAVAGFTESDIEVKVLDSDTLVIQGESAPIILEEGAAIIHQGISTRKFKRTFVLYENMVVHSARIKNGILSVKLEHVIPESMKPKIIPVMLDS